MGVSRHAHAWRGALLGAALLLAAAAPAAGAEAPREVRLKAAFVERFLHFVEWTGPKAGTDTLAVGIAGRSPLAAALREAAAAGGRAVVVREGLEPDSLAAVCHVIFVPEAVDGTARAGHPRWGDLTWTAAHNVLTVGEDAAFVADGGVIGFYTEGDRLRFAVATVAADRAGLQIGSKLLRLAKVIP